MHLQDFTSVSRSIILKLYRWIKPPNQPLAVKEVSLLKSNVKKFRNIFGFWGCISKEYKWSKENNRWWPIPSLYIWLSFTKY